MCLWVSFLSLLVSLLLYTVTALLYRSTQAPFLNAHCRHDDVATALIRGNLQNVTGCPDKRPDESHLALDGSQLQVGSSSSPYALRLPHETKSSTKQLAPTNWAWKTFSKPASLKKRSLVALPVAISHKVSLKAKLCASATPIQKNFKK